MWADFVDGVLTVHNLNQGNLELNLWMGLLWSYSPLLYANVKFLSLWVGVYFLNHSTTPTLARMRVFLVLLGVLSAVDLLHLRILWLIARRG
jgi:hypothetical protein